MKKKELFQGYTLVVLSAFLFGCMPMVTNYIYAQGINRESVVLLRNLLALPVLGLLAWHQSKSFHIPVKALPAIIDGISRQGLTMVTLTELMERSALPGLSAGGSDFGIPLQKTGK